MGQRGACVRAFVDSEVCKLETGQVFLVVGALMGTYVLVRGEEKLVLKQGYVG
jgi:hypothetical protein